MTGLTMKIFLALMTTAWLVLLPLKPPGMPWAEHAGGAAATAAVVALWCALIWTLWQWALTA